MPEKSLGTEPDLNFGVPRVSRFSRETLERHFRHRWERDGRAWDSSDLAAAVKAAMRHPDPTAARVRIKGIPLDEQRVFVRRDGDEVVRYSNGLVELANVPDFDFDFRVRFELIEGEDGPVLAPSAVAVIARPGDVGAVRGGDFARAGVARAVKYAAQVLTRRQEVDEGGRPRSNRRAAGSDVEYLMPRELAETESRHRKSSRTVEDEARAVARAWLHLAKANGGTPRRGYAATIAGKLGWGTEAPAAERVRKRLVKARRMGLLARS